MDLYFKIGPVPFETEPITPHQSSDPLFTEIAHAPVTPDIKAADIPDNKVVEIQKPVSESIITEKGVPDTGTAEEWNAPAESDPLMIARASSASDQSQPTAVTASHSSGDTASLSTSTPSPGPESERPDQVSAKENESNLGLLKNLVIGGVITDARGNTILINSKTLNVGDKIGEMTISEITPRYIRLRCKNKKYRRNF